LGSSGCGKSTLLRMLAGFESPTSGGILLGGEDVARSPPYERPMNMMFQSYALFPHLDIWDNIAFGLQARGAAQATKSNERVGEMLDLVQLGPVRQAQAAPAVRRAAAARGAWRAAWPNAPSCLLLDEPLGALDKKLREQTQFELVNIIEQVGVTCVMVTHDQEEAMTMANAHRHHERRAGPAGGRRPRRCTSTPASRFVADFIGNVNLIEGKLTVDEPDHCAITTGIGVVSVGHGISGALNMPVAVAVRPEKLEISKTKPDVSANLFTGKVKEIAYFGSYNTYIVIASDGSRIKITEANTSRHDLSDITWDDSVYFWWGDRAAVVLRCIGACHANALLFACPDAAL